MGYEAYSIHKYSIIKISSLIGFISICIYLGTLLISLGHSFCIILKKSIKEGDKLSFTLPSSCSSAQSLWGELISNEMEWTDISVI